MKKKCQACGRRHPGKAVRRCLLGTRNNPGQLEKASKAAMRARDKGLCQWCGVGEGKQHHWSHVIPKGRCGLRLRFDMANVKDLCATCHRRWHECPLEAAEWFSSRFPDRREYLDARMVETRSMGTVTVDELLAILGELRLQAADRLDAEGVEWEQV